MHRFAKYHVYFLVILFTQGFGFKALGNKLFSTYYGSNRETGLKEKNITSSLRDE